MYNGPPKPYLLGPLYYVVLNYPMFCDVMDCVWTLLHHQCHKPRTPDGPERIVDM